MIGIVLVSHGNLANEFAKTLEHIVGPQESLVTVSLFPDDDMEVKRKEIQDAIQRVEKNQGVVILTDMFGGTPSNLAHSLLKGQNVEIVAGMNLPLLIKLVSSRKTKSLHESVLLAQEAGRKYIHVASQTLSENKG
ncbi:PTS sugar transporter subunit IIA [Kamptonema cortianum]|jgi:PTS system mannose-specific IIA component|nr:PTS sugar transporter subunit IIA [Geitlerinema splendidum]MDK3157746.1 PTS sugar transporter subunit IIA [Kamptonema cortianum]